MFRRKGLLIPLLVAVTATAYVHLFVDSQLKYLIEYYASVVNGAQVNIGELNTSLLRGRLDMKNIQVAHHTQPSRNLVEVEELNVQFLWLPLLAGKFISPEIRVAGIKLFTSRNDFGAISFTGSQPLPPALLDRVATGAYEPLRREFSDTPLRKLGLLSAGLGTQSRIDQLKSSLASLKTIEEVSKEVEFRARTWEKTASVFQPALWMENARGWLAEHKAKPQRKTASLNPEFQSLRGKLKEERQKAKDAYDEIQEQASAFQRQMTAVDEYLPRDVALIRDSFGLPRLDGGDFTHALLGPKLLNFLERASYWVDVSRRRMPTTGHEYDGIIVMERSADKGRDILFGKRSTYPLVLLKRVVIESTPDSANKHQGQVKGEIKNFTTDPPIWGQPTQLDLAADFAGIAIRNLQLKAEINHTQNPPSERFHLSVDSFPLREWMLENTSDLKLMVKQADAKLQFEGSFRGDEVLTQWSVVAAQVEYGIETKFRLMQETMREAFVPFSSLYISGKVKGTTKDLKLELASNVGKRIGTVLRDKFRHSLAAVDDTLRQSILDRVEYPRRRLRDQLAEVLKSITQQYEGYNRQLDDLEKALDQVEPKPRTRLSRS